MAKLVVMSNPVDGKEEEYNRWYDDVHVPELLTVPGIEAAQRFKLKTGAETWNYLCIYEIGTSDPEAVLADMRGRMAAGEFERSDSIDMSTGYMGLFEPR